MSLSLCKKRRAEVDNGAIKRPRNENLSTTHGNLSQSQLVQNNVRCGKVIKIQLINFMCHANLSIDFHARINFLVGSNGSGKSAILAALVLGLGAKAKATNRSASMKQFIKNGENTAKIIITLENSGPESYEADVYGDEITVVRSITQHGATFTIKNKLGDVISRKADELHRILMYHNVQVDNPVFVLNQDNAREFLKDLEPSRNYKLFLKATQLETVMDKLNDCLHSYRDQQSRMQCFNLAIQNRRQEIESLNAKYRQLMSVEELKSELATKELERSWLTVTQEEKELQEFCEKIEAREQKQKSLLEMVKNRSEVELELKKEIRQFEEQISNKTSSIAEANSLYNQTRTQFNKISDRCGELESFLSSFKKRYVFLEGQIKELKNNIEERSKNNVGDIAEVRERNENALSELKNMLEETEAIIGTVKRDLQILVDNKRQQEEKIGEIRRHQNSLDEEMRRIQSHIRYIQASSKDKLSIYGEDVSKFLMEIDNYYKAGKFSELPRGPIGRYIEVPNSKFRDVVENQTQSLLRAFIVTNTEDRLLLECILQNNFPNYHPVIITMRFMKQVYDVTCGSVSPPRSTRLLMHEIRCSDPVVMNCLIDRLQLETILLAETKDIAEYLTSHRENVPENLNRVIVPQLGLEYYPDPHYRMYSLKIRPASLIQVHVEDQINQLEAEQLERQQRFQQYAEESAAQEHQLKEDMKLIKEKRGELEKYAAKKREMREDMLELENFQYPEHGEVDILKRELQEHEIKLDQVKAKIVTKKAELTEAYDEKQRLEIELKSRKTTLQSIEYEINEIKSTCEESCAV